MDTTFWKDAAERAVWTFAQAFLGSVTIGSLADLGNKTMWAAAAVAGIGSVLSLVKSAVGRKVGNKGTAQLGAKTYA